MPSNPPALPARLTRPDAQAVVDALNLRLHEVEENLLPAGSLIATARSSAPDGYLLCDGSAVSRTKYTALFTAIGTTYGAGDGSTTFNLPNLVGKFPLGKSGSHALGASGGEEEVTLKREHLPTEAMANNNAGSTAASGVAWLAPNVFGGGKAHTNMPPWQAVNYLIKT